MPSCPNCGHHLSEGTRYCSVCGEPQPFEVPAAPPSRTLPHLPLANYFQIGWDLFRQYPYGFISFCLLTFLIQMSLHLIPIFGSVVSMVISPALMMGNFIVAARILHRQTPRFGDFFSGFYYFGHLLLVSLVGSLLIGIGLLFLIIPGIYLTVGYLFASCLVVDRRLDFWSALELSRRTVTPLWFSFFAFLLLLLLINLAGALLLGLGLLASVPISFCALTVAFQDLFGFHSDYTQPVPRLKTG
jgi:uncharacterized membrane protein